MPRTPPAEGYRLGNSAPDSHPVRSKFQKTQSFGWADLSGAVTRNPRGGSWVGLGDASPIGGRLFQTRTFTTGDQGKSLGIRRPDYGSE
jgi:hypothetical protein